MIDYIQSHEKKTLINLIDLISYEVCSLTIMELNYKLTTERYLENPPNVWELNNIHLNNPSVKKYVTRKIMKYFEWNENENTT